MTASVQPGGPNRNTVEGGAPNPWSVLVLTSLPIFAVSLDTTVLYVAFRDLQRTFRSVSAVELSWVLNAYTIVFGALLVTAGRLADRVGRKRTFLWGAAIFTLASALCGLAPSAGLLIAARVLQAVGAAMLMPTSLALILAAFPREKRPMAISIWGAVGALAAAVGPAVGSAIVQSVGWRWTFYLNLPIGIFALLRARTRIAESAEAAQGRLPDALGVALAIASPALLALGIIEARAWGPASFKTVATLGGSMILLAILIVEASRSRAPVIDLTLFRDRNYRLANWASLVFSIAFSGMFFGLILFMTQVWGYSILATGLSMTPGPLSVIGFAIIAGRVATKRGHRGLLLVGGIAFAMAALLLLLFVTERPAFLLLFLPTAILFGMGVGFVLPSLSSVAAHGLPADRFALGVAVNQAIRQVGSMLGVAFVVALVARASAGTVLPFRGVFTLLVVGGLLTGLLGSLVRTAPLRSGEKAVEL